MSKTENKANNDISIAKKLLEKKEVFKGKQKPNYKVSTGSLQLDLATEGGLGAGIHRFCGGNEGGKTAESLVVMSNFLSDKGNGPRKGIFVNAEFRLSSQKRDSVSFKFVEQDDIENWEVGTCLVLDTNSYETVAHFINTMVKYTDVEYCIVVDSLDALMSDADVAKTFGDSNKVAGGAVIASNLSKRIAIPTRKFGHMIILVSQVRSKIHQGMGHAPAEQVNSTGGNALLHASDYIFEFVAKRNQGNLMKDKDDSSAHIIKNKQFGHTAYVKICKSENESSGYTVDYPIKYVNKHGKIWVEKEVFEMLKVMKCIETKGSWFSTPSNMEDPLYKFLSKNKTPIQEKVSFQGANAFVEYLEDNPKITNSFYEYLLGLWV
tara:strand:+ start:7332 stop:8465 length:1134 start_codon:yes stop_codon:yes gene_type:complete